MISGAPAGLAAQAITFWYAARVCVAFWLLLRWRLWLWLAAGLYLSALHLAALAERMVKAG